MNTRHVLMLPGWQTGSPDLWSSQWEQAHGYTRVEQHDWQRPLRGDWMSRLEDVVLSCDEPAVLIAHGLGCIQVAAWASHSGNTHRVKAALLIAPTDVERDELRPLLASWSPVPLQKLPFKTVLMASHTAPLCSPERARLFADAWGTEQIEMGEGGHLDTHSRLNDWPQAHAQLLRLMAIENQSH